MSVADISQLSLREKFEVMQAIWTELQTRLENSQDLPESHKELLDARRQRARAGASKLLNWDEVKNSIGTR